MPTEKDQGYVKGEKEVEAVSFPLCWLLYLFWKQITPDLTFYIVDLNVRHYPAKYGSVETPNVVS